MDSDSSVEKPTPEKADRAWNRADSRESPVNIRAIAAIRVTIKETVSATSSEKTPANLLDFQISRILKPSERVSYMNSRRNFLKSVGAASVLCSPSVTSVAAIPDQVQVDMPRGRVPLSFIIDDSTCLVNMGKYCMPQFAATYPQRKDYQLNWREWPNEIPDDFVREFGTWCTEHGVKGKYSIVPNPACVGWLDRTLPGWSQRQLSDSLQLVRDLMLPNWDIHPEMITHTRVIDLKTGRPFEDYSPAHMENSYPQEDVSVDYLASYLAYALKLLKNCDLPCEGITTPGGFGNRVKEKLALAAKQAVGDVFAPKVSHYFKYVISDPSKSTEPTLEAREGQGGQASFVVNIPAGTGDWFGGWTGVQPVEAWRYCNEDATSGRMVDLIEQGQPAIMLCHWPGMYCNGTKTGFKAFQDVVETLHRRFEDQVIWMKLSEIAAYWAAKGTTDLAVGRRGLVVDAAFACSEFTLKISGCRNLGDLRRPNGSMVPLKRVTNKSDLVNESYFAESDFTWVCFDLAVGESEIELDASK